MPPALAAGRGGIKIVLIPEENVKDLQEIPDNIKGNLKIKPVKWIDEVIERALERLPDPLKAAEVGAKPPVGDDKSPESVVTH